MIMAQDDPGAECLLNEDESSYIVALQFTQL